MTTLLAVALLLATQMAPAVAETRHDAKLEQAVMNIVASKMGDIRGSISYRRKLESVFMPGAFPRNSALPKISQAQIGDSMVKLPQETARATSGVTASRVIAAF